MENIRARSDLQEPVTLSSLDYCKPEIGEEVSFGIHDPEKVVTNNVYCIGVTYNGGPYQNPRSWRFSGTLYWADDDYKHDSDTVPRKVSNRRLDTILKPRGTSVNKLLDIYIRKITST